jgi:hypothetical protein
MSYIALRVLLRRWAIAGTLDPLRSLTSLTYVSVSSNDLGGMFNTTHGRS